MAHDDAQRAFAAAHLEGHTVLSYGELAGLAERAAATPGIWPVRCANCPAGRR